MERASLGDRWAFVAYRPRWVQRHRGPLLAAGVSLLILIGVTSALADNFQDDVTIGGSDTFTAPGSTTITYKLVGNSAPSGDLAGCNVDATHPATVNVSAPAGVVASPASFQFTACNPAGLQSVVFSSSTAGNYSITHSISGGKDGALYNNQADFTLHVLAGADSQAPQSASISINNGQAWTNNTSGNVVVDISATDNVGVASYRLAETQAGLGSATAVPVSPAEPNFSRDDSAFVLTGVEGTAKAVWLRVCDGATSPNCSDASDTIGWDKTAPSVAYTSASPAPNGAGWNKTNVTATFTATDNLSGFAPGVGSPPVGSLTTTGTNTTSGEGAAVTVGSPAFADIAGNTAVAGAAISDPYMIDKTPPSVSVTNVSEGAIYTLGSVPVAGCSTTDGLSTVATSATSSVTGGTVNGVGEFTASCGGASDVAGNPQSPDPVSVKYRVEYAGLSGFLQPINYDDSSLFSRGRAVPGKFRLAGDEYFGYDTSGWILKQVQVSCAAFEADVAELEAVSVTPSTVFRYDASADQYIYNADFRKQAAGTCWRLRAWLDDGGDPFQSAVFKLVK